MKNIILQFCCIITIQVSFGQNMPQEYFSLIKKADSLYEAKQYKNSAFTYSEAFKTNSWKGMLNDRIMLPAPGLWQIIPIVPFFNWIELQQKQTILIMDT